MSTFIVQHQNQLIQQGRYTNCVDELVFKVINAPTKRSKAKQDTGYFYIED